MKTYRIQLPEDKRAPYLWCGALYVPDANGWIDKAPGDLCKSLGLLPQGEPEPVRTIPRDFVVPLPAALPNFPNDFGGRK